MFLIAASLLPIRIANLFGRRFAPRSPAPPPFLSRNVRSLLINEVSKQWKVKSFHVEGTIVAEDVQDFDGVVGGAVVMNLAGAGGRQEVWGGAWTEDSETVKIFQVSEAPGLFGERLTVKSTYREGVGVIVAIWGDEGCEICSVPKGDREIEQGGEGYATAWGGKGEYGNVIGAYVEGEDLVGIYDSGICVGVRGGE